MKITLPIEFKYFDYQISKDEIDKAIENYQINIKDKKALWELNSTSEQSYILNVSNASHKIVELKKFNENYICSIETFDTINGKILDRYYNDGIDFKIYPILYGELNKELNTITNIEIQSINIK